MKLSDWIRRKCFLIMKLFDWSIDLSKSPVPPDDCPPRQLFGGTGAIIKKGGKRGEGEEEEKGRKKKREKRKKRPKTVLPTRLVSLVSVFYERSWRSLTKHSTKRRHDALITHSKPILLNHLY